MEQPASVLVVDDDESIVELMRDFLAAAGYRVLTSGNGPAALGVLDRGPVDCILLDLMMPGQSGFDVLRRIREMSEVPVLILSARQEDSDKIRGLGIGADDYIVKSATPTEIVARVRAVLRRVQRGESATGTVVDYGHFSIDARAHEVRVEGEPVALTPREFELLQLLAEYPRQVFTREDLYERFWGVYGDRHTLTVHIGRIRDKIEKEPAEPRYIITVWGVGYRFEGERRS